MAGLLGSVPQLLESALAGLALRQDIVAQNVANAATPGYKAEDVTFSSTLSQALASGSVGAQVVSAPGAASNDGNTVNLETQLGLINQLSIEQQGLMEVLQADYTSLHTVNQDLSSPGV